MSTVPEETFLSNIPGYIPVETIRESMGVPARTLEDRINALGITVYVNPNDRRRRMIASDDLVKLTTPQPLTRRSERLRHTVG